MTILNLLLPFIFFEIFSILIAYLFVVIIETLIINNYFKLGLVKIFKVCFEANFLTTIIGYFLQGLFRFIIGLTIFMLTDKFNNNSFFSGFFGNVGITKQVYKGMDIEVLTTITTSIVFALIISILFEKYYFNYKLKSQVDKTLLHISIIIANLVSYILLAVWIYINYQLQLK